MTTNTNAIDAYCPACGKVIAARPDTDPRYLWLAAHNDGSRTCVDSGVRVHIRVADYVLPAGTSNEQGMLAHIDDLTDTNAALLEALEGLLRNCPAPKGIRKDFSYILYREAATKAIAKAKGEVNWYA